MSKSFTIDEEFVKKYESKKPPFGYDGLGELIFQRTYSRVKKDGGKEKWFESVKRVVNGTYSMQKRHINRYTLGWDDDMGQKSAQEMYNRMFNMKFLPPGRGLWAMGSKITEEKHLYAALNNCAFVATNDLKKNPTKPFTFLMDASMLGVGVGFNVDGAGTIMINKPLDGTYEYRIPDTREGWVESLKKLLESFTTPTKLPIFDYGGIREAGLPIKTFGGVTSGPEVLAEMHKKIIECLMKNVGEKITIRTIVDIMNLIGKCVVSGNVRRSAEIVFGPKDDESYLDLKNYKVNPHRADYGWTSNNSVYAEVGMDYKKICQRIADNGEPGIAWLDNMQKYGRMGDLPNNADHKAKGGNPCLEQTLESFELCCLVETFPHNHDSLEDYLRTLKFAYLYAKTVTLGQTHWPETNRVMLRNRRIGCSMSGIAQFITKHGLDELGIWCDAGYKVLQEWDVIYSDWFAIPRSIKITSVKPSGTVSLLAGATPGIHYPTSLNYIRRVRISKDSELLPPLKLAGNHMEVDVGNEHTMVVDFYVILEKGMRTIEEVSMWEQLALAAFMQRHWADNQISCTVTFNPKTEGSQLEHALNYYQYHLKGISFLPKLEVGAFPQMPYEAISRELCLKMKKSIKPVIFADIKVEDGKMSDSKPDMFCDSDKCILRREKSQDDEFKLSLDKPAALIHDVMRDDDTMSFLTTDEKMLSPVTQSDVPIKIMFD
jgi:ribonucleoside-triphosphate reductase (thioredoxin)